MFCITITCCMPFGFKLFLKSLYLRHFRTWFILVCTFKLLCFSENQQFLKEVINSVLDGQGLSWLKVSRIKKLMEDENYRNFVVSRLNRNLDKKLSEDARHIDDVVR